MADVQVARENRQLTVTIALDGNLDHVHWPELRRTCLDPCGPATRYVIDFAHVPHVSTPTLGMLLLLREHAGPAAGRVRLVNCGPDVKRTLLTACFELLFEIEGLGAGALVAG